MLSTVTAFLGRSAGCLRWSYFEIFTALLLGGFLESTGHAAGEGPAVGLIEKGKPVATIVIPDGPSDLSKDSNSPHQTALKAAKILNRYLLRSSRAELPVVCASEAPDEGTLVLLGRSAVSDQFQLKPPSEPESARIVSFPRGIAILGEIAPAGTNHEPLPRDRGTIHGTYLFLEKLLGFRFFFEEGPDADLGVVVPNLPTVRIGPVDEVFAPAFPYRQTHDRAPGILLEGSSTGFRCNHTHEGWDAVYQESHPEYFALRADGTRDFTSLCYSNPDVLKRELEHIKNFYETGKWVGSRPPTAKYIQVEPVDNWSECHCSGCQSLIDPQRGRFGRHSRLWWDHYIYNLAEEVAKRWPDKRIAALAYQGRLLPGTKKLPKNVDVMVCLHNAQVNFQKEDGAAAAVEELLKQWSEALGGERERMFVWDYQCYPGFWTTAPIIFPHLQQNFLQKYRNLMGGMFLNRSIDDNHQYTHFMEALTMRLLWDPDLDVDAYLHDYCTKFFGPGAAAMERFYSILIKRYEQTSWPAYHQQRDTAWVSPGMLFGRTYTPDVIDEIEQALFEAQEAVGRIPGGRPSTFEHGEGWFVRRNGSDQKESWTVTLEALDQPVQNPTLRWNTGSLTYEGILRRGQKLVVEPGPKATLKTVQPDPPRELIPEGMRLADEEKLFESGYRVHLANHLGIPAFPGARFVISVSGHAQGGSNSYAEITWRGAPSTFALDSRFSAKPKTIAETFVAPPGAQALESVRLFRRHHRGAVAYANLSLRREFDDIEVVDAEAETDVSSKIRGDVPEIPPHTTFLFHLFSKNSSLGVQSERVDRHLGEEKTPAGEEAETPFRTGGASLRIRMTPEPVEPPPESGLTEYQRRVAWMRDAFEDFHPQRTMYTTHDGFLPSARTAHRWLRALPKYRVARVEAPPRFSTEEKVWDVARPIRLVRGRPRAKVPLENLGFDAGNGETIVRFLQDDNHLYAFFQCTQAEPANDADQVSLTFHGSSNEVSISYNPISGLRTEVEGVTAAGEQGKEQWNAFFRIPKRSILEEYESEVSVEVSRSRQGGLRYMWAPPMNAPWEDLPASRRGRLKFD
jgi:hypothetical protein